jgi:ankyrin repeat protein
MPSHLYPLGYTELAEMLIIRGADMYASGDSVYSKTPLHLACLFNHVSTVEVLIKRGADLEALSGFLDKTPLHLACENGFTKCVELLLRAGADTRKLGTTINGGSAMHLAAKEGHIEIVRVLVEVGHADLSQQGKYLWPGSPLHTACQFG